MYYVSINHVFVVTRMTCSKSEPENFFERNLHENMAGRHFKGPFMA